MNKFSVVAATVFAAGVALTFVANNAPLPEVQGESFTVPPAATSAVCPGPQNLPVGDVGQEGGLGAGTQDRTLTLWGEGTSRPVLQGTAWEAPLGASLERVGDGDLQGIAALTCLPAAFDEWLVGGSTSLGSSARLVLSNPAGAPAEVTVTVFGPLGQVGDPVVVAVAPFGQEERLLEGVAAEVSSLAVHIQASGPGISAVLQDSRLVGFQPGGTDWVSGSQPSTRQVIPAVGSELAANASTLRVVAPEGATAVANLVDAQGAVVWGGARELKLEPGVVTDIAIPANHIGAIVVTADAPVLASARTVVSYEPQEGLEGDLAYDHHWVQGIDDSLLATTQAISPAQGATLSVYSAVGGRVVFVDGSGREVATVLLGQGTVQRVPLTVPAGTVVTTTGAIAWAIEVAANEGTSIAALMPVDISRIDRVVNVAPAAIIP